MLVKNIKRLTSLLIVLLLLAPTCSAFASGENEEERHNNLAFSEERGMEFLEKVNYEGELRNPVGLLNLSGELEAFCFEIYPQGYIIVNCVNGTIPEFSPEAPSPVADFTKEEVFYNGPLDYYVSDTKSFIHTVTGLEVAKKEIVEVYNSILYPLEGSIRESDDLPTRSVESKQLNATLSTFKSTTSSYFCTITGCAIMLDYYRRCYSGTSLPSGVTTYTQICKFLIDNRYIPNCALFLSNAKNGITVTVKYTGLVSYFNRKDITTRTVNVTGYSFSNVRTQIKANRPMLLEVTGAYAGLGNTGSHTVTIHGYYVGNVELWRELYIVVNNGWGSNNVWLSVDSGTSKLRDTLYFS